MLNFLFFEMILFCDDDVMQHLRRLRSIQNIPVLAWDRKWPTRMNESSLRSNYVLTRATSDSKPDLTKEPRRPALEGSEIPDTCERETKTIKEKKKKKKRLVFLFFPPPASPNTVQPA